MLPDFEYDSHHPAKVNYSIPCPTRKWTRAHIGESFKHYENVVSHTTNVLELDFYIVLFLKNKCQALHANTSHPCKVNMGKSKQGTLTQTNRGLKNKFHSNNHIPIDFWFCANEINRCMKGSKKKWDRCLIG